MAATTTLDFVARRESRSAPAAMPARRVVERLGYVLFALFIFFACFTFLRPSPYDFTAIPAMALWLGLGIALHRRAALFVALLVAYNLALLIALVPYMDEPDPVAWTFQSLYLMVTAIFFAMFFARETSWRVELALKAYVASCLFAAAAGIVSYVAPGGILFTMDGRAAGVFEDPNVLGSFLILGALYLLRGLLTGEARRPVLSVLGLGLIVTAIFLSFSRGSWGAFVLGTLVMCAFTFRSSAARVRRRILTTGVLAFLAAALAIGALLSVDTVGERFEDRATVSKDYDEGETGRFGNQLRSLPMLMELPNGFGPLRFRLTFGLDPHNSYIGGFANGGWLGGFAFLGLVLTTAFVGWRLCVRPSPFRAQAQVAVPALLMFFVQALQIDIDHWRHVYLLLGLVWGLECARARWTLASHSDARVRMASPPPRRLAVANAA